MKISVVTVCLDCAKTIGDTVKSFLAQSHPEKEMIVVDGVSKDETLDIVRSFHSDLIRIHSEKDHGIYDAMNKGLKLFSGEAVGFLNADDTFHDTGALAEIANALTQADIAFGDLNMVADHDTKRTVRVWRPGPYTRRALKLGWIAPHPTFYVSRAVAMAVGEFESKFQVASDYDYMLRTLTKAGFASRYIPKLLVDYKMGGKSSGNLRDIVTGNLECLAARRRHMGAPFVDAALFLRPLRRIGQFRL